jgi:UDP-3-O-acyl-N-acetylglucosamine deacetylase
LKLNLARQFTLRESVSFEGVGLHSGTRTCVALHPAPNAVKVTALFATKRVALNVKMANKRGILYRLRVWLEVDSV